MEKKSKKRKMHNEENESTIKKAKTSAHYDVINNGVKKAGIESFVEEKDNKKMKKKKKDKTLILNSAKVEKDNKSTNDELDSPKKKDNKKMKKKKKKKNDKTLILNSEKVENEDNTNEKSAKELAIMYLKQWKKQDEWKFQKVRQVWLLTHMYDSNMVNNKDFNILLKYLDGMKGMCRQTTSTKAQNLIESDTDDVVKSDRARKIVQQLST